MTTDSGWLCPICKTWNPSTSITCVNTPQHDADTGEGD